jgi:hypothetical protein
LPDGTQILTPAQVDESLHRLLGEGDLEGDGADGFRLLEDARLPLESEIQRSQELFDRVVDKHLSGARGGVARNRDVFVGTVAAVFAELGESYVRTILGENRQSEFARGPLVQRILKGLDRRSGDCDVPAVKAGLIGFIEDLTPDAAHVKWNLAQNYYVAKALGLDREGRLLSEEAFGDAEIYLDTNVVIPALEPMARHHKNFQALAGACRGVHAGLIMCQPTVAETQVSVASQREVLEKVLREVPEELESRISNDFFLVARKKLREGTLDVDDLFANYERPAERLAEEYGVEYIDDPWFDEVRESEEIEVLMQLVSTAWERRTGRPKPREVARHDALLLAWVEKRRSENPDKTILLITRDHSLPDVRVGDAESPRAMMVDAFVQWVSPLALREQPSVDFSAIFADAIKYELLPQENFFDPKDFLVFHEMEMSCKELPSDDVEACLVHIKRTIPHLDPRRAEDRERLTAAINRFLVSPGRKYKLELERLEREKEEAERAANAQLNDQKRKADEVLEERDRRLAQKTQEVADLQKASLEREISDGKSKLRHSAIRRFILVLLCLLAGEIWAFKAAFADAAGGDSIWATISSALPLAGAVFGLAIVLGWFLLDRERIEALGWPATKVFRA